MAIHGRSFQGTKIREELAEPWRCVERRRSVDLFRGIRMLPVIAVIAVFPDFSKHCYCVHCHILIYVVQLFRSGRWNLDPWLLILLKFHSVQQTYHGASTFCVYLLCRPPCTDWPAPNSRHQGNVKHLWIDKPVCSWGWLFIFRLVPWRQNLNTGFLFDSGSRWLTLANIPRLARSGSVLLRCEVFNPSNWFFESQLGKLAVAIQNYDHTRKEKMMHFSRHRSYKDVVDRFSAWRRHWMLKSHEIISFRSWWTPRLGPVAMSLQPSLIEICVAVPWPNLGPLPLSIAWERHRILFVRMIFSRIHWTPKLDGLMIITPGICRSMSSLFLRHTTMPPWYTKEP